MPFVQMVRERIAERNGSFTLTPEEEFDQRAVLSEVSDYLLAALHLEHIQFADAASAPAEAAGSCSPGSPLIMYDFVTE